LPILFPKSIGNSIANTFVPEILPITFGKTFMFLDAMVIVHCSTFTKYYFTPLKTYVQITQHRRYACHLLNLVVSTDVTKADISSLKKLSVQMFSKLTALWNKQNRSSLTANKVRESHGKLLPTPDETRYTHTFSGPFSRDYPGEPTPAKQNQTGFY